VPAAIATAPAAPPTATAVPSPTPEPTPIIVAELPLIDLHFHPDPAWGSVVALFDRLGVRLAGNGGSAPDEVLLAEAARNGGRVIAFAGGSQARQLVSRYGQAAWTVGTPEVERFLEDIAVKLRDGRFKGIGELHVNNRMSNLPNTTPFRFPADSPLMQRLWRLSAEHGVVVSVHMDGEPESVAEMERLLASDRRGTWLWAHTGHYAEPALVRRLLAEHPNLYCELSYRVSISPSRTALAMDNGGRLRDEWRALIEDYPDRFVLGTDIGFASPALYSQHIAFWRLLLTQLSPETAAKLAYRNAERLLDPHQ
jgi:predicted TIM-barrel fold metal-dependent hydrolase